MGQKFEFLTKIFFFQKWIFIAAFGRFSLVLKVFVEILVKYYPIILLFTYFLILIYFDIQSLELST
jgi:hypothetical protein